MIYFAGLRGTELLCLAIMTHETFGYQTLTFSGNVGGALTHSRAYRAHQFMDEFVNNLQTIGFLDIREELAASYPDVVKYISEIVTLESIRYG